MGTQSYPVEVQSDFVEDYAARPVQALAELMWNSFDADATKVEVFVRGELLRSMSDIVIRDNGTGIEFEKSPEFFQRLGGSWKR